MRYIRWLFPAGHLVIGLLFLSGGFALIFLAGDKTNRSNNLVMTIGHP